MVTCHDIDGLLEGCENIKTFCTRLEQQSLLDVDGYSPETYVGDGLELLTEAILNPHSVDNRIGITHLFGENYQRLTLINTGQTKNYTTTLP